MAAASIPTWLKRVLAFAAVSGVGLALDFALFLTFVELGVRAGPANFISAAIAVSFVYFVSVRRLFDYRGKFLLRLFLAYLLFQLVAVATASWAVDWIVTLQISPAVAKLLILPLTFSANYLFMSWITRARDA